MGCDPKVTCWSNVALGGGSPHLRARGVRSGGNNKDEISGPEK